MSNNSIDKKETINIGICGVLREDERNYLMSRRKEFLWIYDSLNINDIIDNICLAVKKLDIERANVFFISHIVDGVEEILRDYIRYNNNNTKEKNNSDLEVNNFTTANSCCCSSMSDDTDINTEDKRFYIEHLINKLNKICIVNKNQYCIAIGKIKYIYINVYTDENILLRPRPKGIMKNRNKIYILNKDNVKNHILEHYI